ncbi:methionine aminopeptidase, type I [Desulfurispirillum indicum S5]|uniref:Methionine aminopeptidase n=1 Tax=Desulfurispirillum indicum (strain ATCC BAA-1389 / DSM 22839 / S5) TaxID=653733 RepID=E6W7A2_DESIS|nr:type I methionyl aminopeptidase [Desulfurispirillum indicum]ADU66269.1 methionine aminopeptidase, type I [Desulfurispirillum indicum S5]
MSTRSATGLKLYTLEEIESISQAARIAATVLRDIEQQIKPGIDTETIDALCAQMIADHGATAAPLNYKGFPKSVCTSINNVICHGIPSTGEVLKDGDIINVDITAIYRGYYGDTSRTFCVGEVPNPVRLFVERVEKAMDKGIEAVMAGKPFTVIGDAIEKYVRRFGYSVVRDYCGHGIGESFHEEPAVLHYSSNSPSHILQNGMVFTIEPMVNQSKNWRSVLDKNDGWTARTADGALSAQFEHTIAVVDGRAKVLSHAH